jgi:hypothetical protein
MFLSSRQRALDFLVAVGSRQCLYYRPVDTEEDVAEGWMRTRCDCKYGASVLLRQLEGKGMGVGGEQTGCPELRTLYTIIKAMPDNVWALLGNSGGGVTPAQVQAGLENSGFNIDVLREASQRERAIRERATEDASYTGAEGLACEDINFLLGLLDEART